MQGAEALAFIRLVFFLMFVLTVVYGILWFYSRQMHRAKLNRRWADKGLTGDRAAFIQRGLRQFDRSVRRKLLLLVYIVPLSLIALVIYMVNFA